MKNSKHTPGPWMVDSRGLIYQESTNLGIVRLVSKGTNKDAHLIAAAPEMLEALEVLAAHCPNAECEKYVRNLIKKAKGH